MTKTIPLGVVIRAQRKLHGLSARELSAKAGLSPSYITKLESGEIEPSLKAFGRIARVLRFTVSEVYFCTMQEATKGLDDEA